MQTLLEAFIMLLELYLPVKQLKKGDYEKVFPESEIL